VSGSSTASSVGHRHEREEGGRPLTEGARREAAGGGSESGWGWSREKGGEREAGWVRRIKVEYNVWVLLI
jgi:hypothetical protein